MTTKNQKGFGIIPALLILILISIVSFIGYYVWNQQTSKNKEDTAKVAGQQQTKQETKTIETPKTETKPEDTQKYLVIKEWNLRFKIPDGLSDVRYQIQGDTLAVYAKPSGSSVDYRSDYNQFDGDNPMHAIGILYKTTEPSKTFMGTETRQGKKIGNYYFYTAWAFSGLASGAGCGGLYGNPDDNNCNEEEKAFNLVNIGDTALLNTIQ